MTPQERQYRQEHRDEINARKRRWRSENKEAHNAERRAQRHANIEQVRADARDYYSRHREYAAAQAKQWRLNNPESTEKLSVSTKISKKKHTDKQTEFKSEEAAPDEAGTKFAQAQGLIRDAVDELLEPAKTEYDVLYDFIKKEAPKIIEQATPTLDPAENNAFGEQTIGEIAFGEKFTPEHEKQFQVVVKATKFIARQFKRVITKFFEKSDGKLMFPGIVARLKRLKPDGKYLSNLEALVQRYDAAEKVLAQDALADALA